MSRVKICGLSRAEDIDAVNLALPDYVGFVFAPSRRRVNIETADMLKAKLNPVIKSVGVFVNENLKAVTEVYRSGIIELIQLHGDENDEYIKRLKDTCDGRVIKAIGVCGTLPSLPAEPDYLLFDTLSIQRGGTGKTFDWSALKEYRGTPYFLAGGLTADNIAEVIKTLDPFCVDVSSGVEMNGVKDAGKINEFIRIVRGSSK